MTERKGADAKLGETVQVKEGAKIVRPDDEVVTVTGGLYVVNQTGTYLVDGEDLTVKKS